MEVGLIFNGHIKIAIVNITNTISSTVPSGFDIKVMPGSQYALQTCQNLP